MQSWFQGELQQHLRMLESRGNLLQWAMRGVLLPSRGFLLQLGLLDLSELPGGLCDLQFRPLPELRIGEHPGGLYFRIYLPSQ